MEASHRSQQRTDLLLAGAAVAIATLLAAALGGTHEARALAFFGRFHPLVVHLPIGMLLLGGALEALSFWPTLRARIDPVLAIVLRLSLAAAVIAFALGLMLASGGGYPERLVRLHRWLTYAMVVASASSVVFWSLVVAGRAPRLVHRAAVGLTLTLLGIGAHFGGSITHGDSWLVEYAPAFLRPPAPAESIPSTPKVASDEPHVFDDVVLPILKQRCGSCHGAESAKGRLRVDSLDALAKGGKSGPALKPGSARDSLLVQRIAKPLSDDEHMPPEGKPQLTADELEVLGLWIDRGASPTTTVRELLVPDGARRMLEGAKKGARVEPTPTATAAPATAAAATTTAAPEPTRPQVAAAAGDVGSFDARIAPILAAKCGRCHGATRQRGGLRTDSLDALRAGGDGGPALGANGTLLTRIRLPLDDERHMPPKSAAQLEPSEVDALSRWLSRAPASTARPTAPKPTAAPAPKPTAAPASTASAPATEKSAPVAHPVHLYAEVVKPILEKRCGACHSAEKPFAGVVVTARDALVASGHVVPGRADTSPMFTRMAVALDDEDHMPPKDKPQPSAAEIAAVRLWIDRGASTDGVVDASDVPSGLLAAPAPSASTGAAAAEAPPHAPLDVAKVQGGCAGCTTSTRSDRGPIAFGLGALVAALVVVRRRARVTR